MLVVCPGVVLWCDAHAGLLQLLCLLQFVNLLGICFAAAALLCWCLGPAGGPGAATCNTNSTHTNAHANRICIDPRMSGPLDFATFWNKIAIASGGSLSYAKMTSI